MKVNKRIPLFVVILVVIVVAFCIGKIIKIKFRTDDLNADIVKRLEKDEPECKCNISKIGKAKSFIEKNYDFIQKIIKMLEIINDKINCKDFSYKLGETKQEIPIGEYKIIFDILGKYKIYYKNIELDNLNYGIEEIYDLIDDMMEQETES